MRLERRGAGVGVAGTGGLWESPLIILQIHSGYSRMDGWSRGRGRQEKDDEAVVGRAEEWTESMALWRQKLQDPGGGRG